MNRKPTFTITGQILELMPVILTKTSRRRRQAILQVDGTQDKMAITLWNDHTYSVDEGSHVRIDVQTEIKAAYNDQQRYFTFLNASRVHHLADHAAVGPPRDINAPRNECESPTFHMYGDMRVVF